MNVFSEREGHEFGEVRGQTLWTEYVPPKFMYSNPSPQVFGGGALGKGISLDKVWVWNHHDEISVLVRRGRD